MYSEGLEPERGPQEFISREAWESYQMVQEARQMVISARRSQEEYRRAIARMQNAIEEMKRVLEPSKSDPWIKPERH